jgi:hypothetical protein
LALGGDMAMVEEALQVIGVFVSFSVAYVAYRGVKQTQSSSLLRLATAFVFLGFGFLAELLAGIDELIPAVQVTAPAVVIGGLLLETTGYFFLAFSHAIDVVLSKRMGPALMVLPVVSLSGVQMTDVLTILSLYFVLYGVVETLYSYGRTRKPDTLLIASGLALIGGGTVVQWLFLLNPGVYVLSLVQIIMREMGLLILFTPVLRFTVGGAKVDGPV